MSLSIWGGARLPASEGTSVKPEAGQLHPNAGQFRASTGLLVSSISCQAAFQWAWALVLLWLNGNLPTVHWATPRVCRTHNSGVKKCVFSKAAFTREQQMMPAKLSMHLKVGEI